MQIQFFKPQNTTLQNYIEGYYFLINKENETTTPYLTFPNNNSILSVYENTENCFSENKAVVKGKKNNSFNSDLICHYKKPIEIHIEGNVKELAFYFKPLGLNAFLSKQLHTYTNDSFSNFNPYDDFKETMVSILKMENIEESRQKIEEYWMTKLVGFEHPFLHKAIARLQHLEDEISISDLAKECHTSRQNLIKNFDKHLCKNPSEFRKIHRFREALKSYSKASKQNNLTQLSFDMFFYDQSHLIKDFKSLTGLSPKNFFKKLTSDEHKNVNWLFL